MAPPPATLPDGYQSFPDREFRQLLRTYGIRPPPAQEHIIGKVREKLVRDVEAAASGNTKNRRTLGHVNENDEAEDDVYMGDQKKHDGGGSDEEVNTDAREVAEPPRLLRRQRVQPNSQYRIGLTPGGSASGMRTSIRLVEPEHQLEAAKEFIGKVQQLRKSQEAVEYFNNSQSKRRDTIFVSQPVYSSPARNSSNTADASAPGSPKTGTVKRINSDSSSVGNQIEINNSTRKTGTSKPRNENQRIAARGPDKATASPSPTFRLVDYPKSPNDLNAPLSESGEAQSSSASSASVDREELEQELKVLQKDKVTSDTPPAAHAVHDESLDSSTNTAASTNEHDENGKSASSHVSARVSVGSTYPESIQSEHEEEVDENVPPSRASDDNTVTSSDTGRESKASTAPSAVSSGSDNASSAVNAGRKSHKRTLADSPLSAVNYHDAKRQRTNSGFAVWVNGDFALNYKGECTFGFTPNAPQQESARCHRASTSSLRTDSRLSADRSSGIGRNSQISGVEEEADEAGSPSLARKATDAKARPRTTDMPSFFRL